MVRHGLRTLVKRGHPRALRLVGATPGTDVELLELAVDRDRVEIGDAVRFRFTVVVEGDAPACEAVIDYRVHYAGARGPRAPKVFKLTRRRLEPGRPVTLTRDHRFEHVSARRIHPGRHQIDVQVNGVVLGSTSVDVLAAAGGPAGGGDGQGAT